MKELKYFTIIMAAFLSSCTSFNSLEVFNDKQAKIVALSLLPKPTQQLIKMKVPLRFSVVAEENRSGGLTLLPSYQSLHWQEKIETAKEMRAGRMKKSLSLYFNHYLQSLTKLCTNISAEILAQDAHAIFYKLTATECLTLDSFYQFGKILNGMDAIYVVNYRAKIANTPKAFISQGRESIQSAALVTNPRFLSKN